jgi:F-box/leucine-rich repeat protein 7
LRILSYLPSAQLALCGRVCRRWHVLAWEPQLWSTIVLTGDNLSVDRALKVIQFFQSFTFNCDNNDNFSSVQSITRVLGRASPPFCPAVERVLLNGCPRLTDRGIQTLSRRCPELRHIELRGCGQVTDVGVLELVSKCVHLSHLDVSGESF